MIQFLKDEKGQLVEFEPENNLDGVSLYICACDQCGKQYRYLKNSRLDKVKCECTKPKPETLTIQGTTSTVDDWLTQYSHIKRNSVLTRLNNRKAGRRICSDAEVLWGYGKHGPEAKLTVNPVTRKGWQLVFVHEFNKRVTSHPLMDAVFRAIEIASTALDFDLNNTPFTKEGLEFERDGIRLPELLHSLGDMDRVKGYLIDDFDMTDTQIKTLIK